MEVTADCPFGYNDFGGCSHIKGPEFCGMEIPKDCPLIKSDTLIHLVRDMVVV